MKDLIACLIFFGAVGVAIGVCAFTKVHRLSQRRTGLFLGLVVSIILLLILLTWFASNLIPSQGSSNWIVPTLYKAGFSGFGSGLLWAGIVLLLPPSGRVKSLLRASFLGVVWLPLRWNRVRYWLVLGWMLSVAIAPTQILIRGMIQGFPRETIPALVVFNVVLPWSQILFFSLLALSKLEFSTQGISVGMFTLAKWPEITSYCWRRNTLEVCVAGSVRSKPISLHVSSKHREAVEHILAERLPDKLITSEETAN